MTGRLSPLLLATLLAAVVPLIGASAGCQNSTPGVSTEEAVALPGVKVELPPPPSFANLNQPVQTPDGNMTVFGLHKGLDKYLGKEVKVKAFLLEIYQCPPCP